MHAKVPGVRSADLAFGETGLLGGLNQRAEVT